MFADTFLRLHRGTVWEPAGSLALPFDVRHPQGMVRIGGVWWISTVDIADRSGWVLAVDDVTGALLDRVPVGDDVRFHPGGMDFDGTSLWIACSEYRPRSTATIARLVPGERSASVAFGVDDHVGAVVRCGPDGDLVGWTWGSRHFKRWRVDDGSEVADVRNPGHFVDHQDGQWLGDGFVVCGGVGADALGGIGVLRADDLTMVREVPFPHRSPATGRAATQNPIFAEVAGDAVIVHLLPDDGKSASILSFATPRR
ncbi:MAG TPA: DUF6454 family protein [Acidimicrobiales bacterium]|nr:DUF6454 family protein [Acidimicrobiales bacterium]